MIEPATERIDHPYTGTGWAFPVRWSNDDGAATPRTAADRATGIDKVEQAMELIVRTDIGERRMRPTFGSSASSFVFEPANDAAVGQLGYFTERALKLFEPRALIDRVDTLVRDEGRVDIVIEFRMDRHRRPTSLVVPFYPDPGGAP